MKVYEFGSETAPAILLLPGTCCHWKGNFGRVIPLLERDFRVRCVSYDGFDETERTLFPTMPEETAKIEAYIHTRCGGHIRAAYGCSLGGSFVGLLAARRNIRMDYGILGSSDLDQASKFAARIQTDLFLPLIYVLYSTPCRREILARIALHYPEAERDAVWERVQRQYVDFLSDWRTDLGGEKNFHNGAGGTYDCIAILSYYTVCKGVTSFREIEEMEKNLILPAFRRLSKFVDCNKPFWRALMYKAFRRAKAGCDKWHDYEMTVAPYRKDQPIYYEFTACPAAEFALKHGLGEIMPALCNVDYVSMELIHARLVRTTTCANGCRCDYTICGDRDPYLKAHPECRDEAGYRRNR